MVPVKIRRTVSVRVDEKINVSSEIQAGFWAFGQIYFMISQIVQKEIEEEEYSEHRSR